MSYPVLFSDDEKFYSDNGLGVLTDCISCEVTEERNGAFELIMQYPIWGIHFSKIYNRCQLRAKPNQKDAPQIFRIYSISKPISGIVTISAAHISYELTGIPCEPFSATNVSEAFQKIKDKSVIENPFTFSTDMDKDGDFVNSVPNSVKACIGGNEESILGVYGGELKFDNFKVTLYNERGKNRGVAIKYGKNLTDLKQEENFTNVYTGVYPYYVDSETGEVTDIDSTGIGKKIIRYSELDESHRKEFNFDRIKTLDLSDKFEKAPVGSLLALAAVQYMTFNDIGTPAVSLNVSFVQLEQTEEYKDKAVLEEVYLCDTVTVEFPMLRVNATAKAIKVVYDVLLDRVKLVQLGTVEVWYGQRQKRIKATI